MSAHWSVQEWSTYYNVNNVHTRREKPPLYDPNMTAATAPC